MTSPASWLHEALTSVSRARIAVFGDFALDAYWFLETDTSEVSVETGRPVHRVSKQSYWLGGAANVAANAIALGAAEVRAIGVIGDDLFGRELRHRLGCLGVDTSDLVSPQDDWQTPVFAKPHLGLHEQDRFDFGTGNLPTEPTIDDIIARLDRAASQCDAVILNQQIEAGLSTDTVIQRLNEVVRNRRHCCFLVDSRHRQRAYRGAIKKLNVVELCRMSWRASEREEELEALTEELYRLDGVAVFVTRGSEGLIVGDRDGVHTVAGIPLPEPTNPVGAGDTVVATVAAVLGGGGDSRCAAELANLAAAVTVTKLRTTGTATPAEIQDLAVRLGR
jgi:rfaE bifunctional protein kinase chain/domain